MIKAEKIVDQVQQGSVPDSWHVWSGHVSLVATTLFLSIFTLFLASLCELMLGGALAICWDLGFSLADLSAAPDVREVSAIGVANLLHILAHLELWLLGWPLVIATFVGYLSWQKALKAKDTVLILTPEGVVQCANCSNESRRVCKVLDFSEINSMVLRSRSATSAISLNFPMRLIIDPSGVVTALSTPLHASHAIYWLDLQRHNGEWERWPIEAYFGPPDQTARAIIQAQNMYVPALSMAEPLWTYA